MVRILRTFPKGGCTEVRIPEFYSSVPYINIDATKASQQASVFAFKGLGNDILKCIFDFISQPTEMSACCLVSRTLRAHALPRLYNSIHLSLDVNLLFDHHAHYVRLLATRNPGLKHIWRFAFPPNRCLSHPSTSKWVHKSVEALHRDQLIEFR